jgi:hypothetical protein
MTLKTSSTYRITQRAHRAIETGQEYVFVGAAGRRARIGYVAGGAFIRVDLRSAAGELIDTLTVERSKIHSQLAIFDAHVRACDNGEISERERGLEAEALVLMHMVRATEGGSVERLRALNEAHREVMALLDQPE